MHIINKYILQYLLQNGVLNVNDGEVLIKKVAEKFKIKPSNLKNVITSINKNIINHMFRIDIRTCEITGENVCVFVNTSLDDLSKTQTSLLPVEVELLKMIIENIMLSNSKCFTSIMCLNLTTRLKGHLTKDNAQNKIKSWCMKGYLIEKEGIIYLGPRAIAEFESFLKNEYATKITKCKLCTDTVYFGKICADCNEIFHNHCITKHLNRAEKCPICKQSWRETDEKIYEQNDDTTDDDAMDEDYFFFKYNKCFL